jgi:polysaccharide biosynthesis protein PslF
VRRPVFAVPVTAGPDGPGRSFGVLSSFPPTACGIATFSAALAAGLVAHGATVEVVRSGAAPDIEDPVVRASIGDDNPDGRDAALEVLEAADVAIVQHEYGIYAGRDGEAVVGILAEMTVPTIVVAHTVVQQPSPHQRSVLEQVCNQADSVVVMTTTARNRLVSGYWVDPAKVVIIPHGAATPPPDADADASRVGGSSWRAPRLLTWGLLGPGKGIEWAIDAVASLADLEPAPSYLVAGATHPKVLARSGEAYREMLTERAEQSGAAGSISFDDSYRDLSALTDLIRSADLVVLPYDSQDQVTSGVLVDAVAAGRPVVSTAFPHAVELLASGAGLVVPQADPVALASAIRSVLTRPELAAAMAAEARRLAPDLSWKAVAGQYDALARRLVTDRSPAETPAVPA